ncbi:Pep1-like protein [Colletotrichum truncatum]|uniref:Pep1-like protein n=1 Tax=Colletotrichum truncatum TaxID=5467 RepID=A0ACC3Z728_COLTU|nr:Pep1-like protein [Colletotrichum truncatum]KAF6785250.1 Pep1-like protein [Colletotrichum truncatum]
MRDLEKRSSFTVPVCRFREPGPRSGGQWLFMDGYGDRTGTDVNTFKLTCQASTQHADIIYRVPGQCESGQWCVEYHGYSELGQAGHDIVCVDKGQIHTWALNSFHNPGKSACSAGWNNRGKTNLKATLEVDVMDSAGLNRIAPQEVYYLLNQKRIGVSRGYDSEVGSGSVIIPPGGSLQACVTPIAGQILNMLGALTSLVRV